MTDYIQDGDGRLFEVVEGSLGQDERYTLVWQDIADSVDLYEGMGMARGEALTAALAAVDRKSVFVQRVPNSVDPAPSDGVHRVYLWNTDGMQDRPGFLARALERPSKGFYERRRADAAAASDAAITAKTEAQEALVSVEASIGAAKTIDEYRAVVDAGLLDEKARLTATIASADETHERAAAAQTEATESLAALNALSTGRTGPSVEAIAATIAETRRRLG